MRKVLVLLAITACQLIFAQSPVVVNWARTDIPTGALEYRYTHNAVLSNGDYLVGGYVKTTSAASSERALVRCMRPNGSIVWERIIGGPALTPRLRVSQLRVLSGSIIFVAATGDSGLIASLSAASGATLGQGVVGSPTFEAAIGPDGTSFFASLISLTETVETENGFTTNTNRTLTVHRFSNALAASSTSAEAASSYYNVSGSDYVDESAEDPKLVFAFGQNGVYAVFASVVNVTNSTGYQARRLRGQCIKFLANGAVAWKGLKELEFERASGNELNETTAKQMDMGAALSQPTQIIYQHNIRDDATNTWSGYTTSIGFFDANGEYLDPITSPILHEFLAQNGANYFNTHYPGSARIWFKFNVGVFVWRLGAQAVNRFPFQLTLASMVGGKTRISRYSDSTGLQIDRTELTLSCDRYLAVVENPSSGDGLLVGDKALAGGRTGAFVIRYSQAPVAVGNSFSTARNTTLNGASVLLNDRFGVGARAQVQTPTRNGVLTLNQDGSFTYVPRAGFAGSDSFVYQAYRPGIALFSAASVFITVTP